MIRLAPNFSCRSCAQLQTTSSSTISARPLHHNGPPLSYNCASAEVDPFGRPEYGFGGYGRASGGVNALRINDDPSALIASG